jgi:hypothetical protein
MRINRCHLKRFELPSQNNNQNSDPNPSISSKFKADSNKNRLTVMSSGPFFPNAPKEIHFELYDSTIRQNRTSFLVVRIGKWAVKFTADDRTIINHKPLELYL